MKKKKYEVPITKLVTVELEHSFMSASVFEPTDRGKGVKTEGHYINGSWGFEEDTFENNEWDKNS